MRLSRTALIVGLAELLAACSPAALIDLAVPRSGYHVARDLAYGPDPRQKLDLYVPDKLAAPAPVMLFFYGGSWKGGSKSLYRAFGQAFASQGIAVLRELGIAEDGAHVNPNGGAIALGHPLGMSGARIAGTAALELSLTGGKRALATMCIGVGQGIAIALERV